MAEGKKLVDNDFFNEIQESEEAIRFVESGEFEEIAEAMHNAKIAENGEGPSDAGGLSAIAKTLSNPDYTLTAGSTAEMIRQNMKQARSSQSTAREFLSRPYYENKASRFLFSCADEPESYALNRGAGWSYTLPDASEKTESSRGSSSTDARG